MLHEMFLQKGRILNEADEPQTEFIISLADSDKILRKTLTQIIKNCSDFEQIDACEASYKVRENMFFKII